MKTLLRTWPPGPRFWLRAGLVATALAAVVLAVLATRDPGHFFLTPDQRGQRLLDDGKHAEAAEAFRDPLRKAEALFKAAEFERAAALLQGVPGADATYNHGNALLMAGKYDQAAERYERALQLRPDWEAARINRGIALVRAERLRQEGGEGTGGKLGADEIVFSDKPTQTGQGDEMVLEGEGPANDAGFQDLWLRQVETTPSQFLKAKFSYQNAHRSRAPRNGRQEEP